MDTQFLGEHLRPGQLGHFFVIISFVAALFSTFSYLRAVFTEKSNPLSSQSWLLMGRGGFILHTASVIGIFSTLFYIIQNHLFEYHYAYEHSSLSLPPQYLLSCFWEGQQGSFMLWMFWHSVLGLVVMRTAKSLETRTMVIISFVQVILGTMILGFYFGGDIKIGSTPFMLLRHAMQGAPIFAMANYMDFIKDGNGLNVLLQNYWMVIHPPILFLGFALTLIPFAYSIAALWKGEYKDFIKPTIAWSLLNGAVLGTGIMMGGAWAYESLNFGGYWAWDPVENASLVPWLVLISGLHTILIYRATGRALPITIIFFILTHMLIWYSTFLTRTGILGKTSVHAFTGDGQALYYHLLVVMGVLLAISIGLLIWRWKGMPRIKTEEEGLSREFWMFIGSIVIFLASIQITVTTSIPVWAPLAKWISGKDFAPPTDVMAHYNGIQVFVAVIVGLLAATVIFMKYKNTDAKTLGKHLGITALIALVMSVLIGWGQHITMWQYDLMLFTSCYGIVATIYYGIMLQKFKFKKLGPTVAHLGFAAVLLGILLSSYNKHTITYNNTGVPFNADAEASKKSMDDNRENEVLSKGVPAIVGDFQATYIGDSDVAGKDRRVYYKVSFDRYDMQTKKVVEHFMLYPDAFINPKGMQGLSANPSTQHYWDHDIFTYITGAADKGREDTATYQRYLLSKPGDTITVKNGFLVYNGLGKVFTESRYVPVEGDLPVQAKLTFYSKFPDVPSRELNPLYILRDRKYITYLDDTLPSMGLYAHFANLVVKSQNEATAEVLIRQTEPIDDFIVLKALVFPYINVLWLGVIIMVFGFFISLGDLISRAGKKVLDTKA